MVTTRLNNIELVTGDYAILETSLKPQEWEEIINAAVRVLTIGYLHGLTSLESLLKSPNSTLEERNIRPGLFERYNFEFSRSDLLYMVRLKSLPKDSEWLNEPVDSEHCRQAKESFLVFRRGRHGGSEFCRYTVTWNRYDLKMARSWDRPQYHLSAIWMNVERQLSLTELLTSSDDAASLGPLILRRLTEAQASTKAQLQERFRNAEIAARSLSGMMARVKRS